MRLRGAMIYVKDLARMAEFYEVSLGLKPIQETRTETWLEFDAAGARFALHAVPPDIASRIELRSPPEPRQGNPVKLIFEIEDVAAEVGRLEALGVTVIRRPWGACDVIDPEGNILQMVSTIRGR